jgi:hypothetical protein
MVAIVVFLSLFRAAPFAASMAVARIGDDRNAPHKAAMKWRAAGSGFLAPRGMSAEPAGEESCDGRCGRTIEAEPVSDQTCLIEPAEDVAYAAAGGT